MDLIIICNRIMSKKLWEPKVGESYFFAEYIFEENEYSPTEEILGVEDNNTFDFPIFKSVDECRLFCHELNKKL